MDWNPPTENEEQPENKQVCKKCGNDTFKVYVSVIIDDARLYCANCGEYFILIIMPYKQSGPRLFR